MYIKRVSFYLGTNYAVNDSLYIWRDLFSYKNNELHLL